jgi:osmotically-inducible protein OsmY
MRRWQFLALLALASAGCNRQDVDGLERIGRKVLDRTQAAVSPLREKFDHTIRGIGNGAGLRERVQQRLQWDKSLAATRIEVSVTDAAVELQGKIKSDEQRRRAVELAESTLGVERVTDRLQAE